jgi:segregation and condensation protein B
MSSRVPKKPTSAKTPTGTKGKSTVASKLQPKAAKAPSKGALPEKKLPPKKLAPVVAVVTPSKTAHEAPAPKTKTKPAAPLKAADSARRRDRVNPAKGNGRPALALAEDESAETTERDELDSAQPLAAHTQADEHEAPLVSEISQLRPRPDDEGVIEDGEPGADEGSDGEAATATDAHLKRVIESLIFVSDQIMSAQQIARLAKAKTPQVKLLIAQLMNEYEGRGIELVDVAGGFQFRSAAVTAPFVRDLVAQRPVRLTRAQLETLALIAYRQPITRPEIDDVRGVDSGSAIKVLLERDLVKILGRKDEAGRPLLYGTAPYFLEFFGMNSMQDLPTLREFTELSEEHRDLFQKQTGEIPDLSNEPSSLIGEPEEGTATDGDDSERSEHDASEIVEAEGPSSNGAVEDERLAGHELGRDDAADAEDVEPSETELEDEAPVELDDEASEEPAADKAADAEDAEPSEAELEDEAQAVDDIDADDDHDDDDDDDEASDDEESEDEASDDEDEDESEDEDDEDDEDEDESDDEASAEADHDDASEEDGPNDDDSSDVVELAEGEYSTEDADGDGDAPTRSRTERTDIDADDPAESDSDESDEPADSDDEVEDDSADSDPQRKRRPYDA